MENGGTRLLKELKERKEVRGDIKKQKRAKAKWMWTMVKKGMAFCLKPWQYSTSTRPFSHQRMSAGANFVAHVMYASKWDAEGVITKYEKVSWNYVQCELCVCSMFSFYVVHYYYYIHTLFKQRLYRKVFFLLKVYLVSKNILQEDQITLNIL